MVGRRLPRAMCSQLSTAKLEAQASFDLMVQSELAHDFASQKEMFSETDYDARREPPPICPLLSQLHSLLSQQLVGDLIPHLLPRAPSHPTSFSRSTSASSSATCKLLASGSAPSQIILPLFLHYHIPTWPLLAPVCAMARSRHKQWGQKRERWGSREGRGWKNTR